jgi:hypothetical protein
MVLTDLEGAFARLQVEKPITNKVEQEAGLCPAAYLFIDVVSQQTGEKLVHLFAFPQSIHIGLAETERPLGHDAPVEFVVPDLDIPGIATIETDSRLANKLMQ